MYIMQSYANLSCQEFFLILSFANHIISLYFFSLLFQVALFLHVFCFPKTFHSQISCKTHPQAKALESPQMFRGIYMDRAPKALQGLDPKKGSTT